MKKVYVAQVEVQEDKLEQFIKETAINIEKTKKELGCIFYEIYQNHHKPVEFLFYEEFQDEQSVREHLETKHLQEYVDSVKSLLAKDFFIQVF